ncbi:PKD domain-containing protein [Algoriphagus sp. AGSA1]|uniref:PKD domain-containing protein n=1 Tax=Algoriphagus sp. AGSA1 TaxID=2907213 RepID=UPI001F45B57A|nr:PKD domain-containing protein [Algoriphagus sp. AGSA1]MCE7055262.1 PKD domain-containing protein [Algoriphagus sp. AGSA1]
MNKALVIVFIFVIGLVPGWIHGQVSVPREGFPYCEPFTGTAAALRAETIIGGAASVGNGYLELTANDTSESGYVYIDIPFSSEYGIKASFEYVSYGGSNPGADGFSFFMFDGNLGPDPGPNQFAIGGFGGSLGYAPREWPANVLSRSDGLKGAYIGIAFDEWGNFVREFEKDSAAHAQSEFIDSPHGLGNNLLTGNGTYPHTVSIRGPHNASGPNVPYGLIDYRQVNFPTYTPFPFRIDVPSNVIPDLFNCGDANYRKVFIELVPIGGFYQVSVTMKVGNQIVDIFNGPVNYNFNAPNSIKLGFAASTGWNTNHHLIRNLAVDVSTIDEALRPEVSENEKRTCVNQGIEITIDDINLKTGANAFIQCVQLYDPALLGTSNPPWEETTANVNHLDCGPADICKECSTTNLQHIVPGLGVFVLEPLGDLEFDSNGNLIGSINDVKVTFTPEPDAIGTAEVLYTAQDNYGLISEPAVIRVIINPIPEILEEVVVNPTCDGQDDGEIWVRVGNLLDGATYRWIWDGNPITTEAPIPNIVNDEAELTLTGVNLGGYRLEVFNPLNDGLGGNCPNLLDEIIIDLENGTPVELEPFDTEICEGTPAEITPFLDPSYNPNNLLVPFSWYSSPDRSGGPLPVNGTATIDGSNVNVQITADGTITIEGLEADGLNSKDYTLYVETTFSDNSGEPGDSGNFCPFIGDVITEATITVYPALDISPQITPDWCRDAVGQIQIEALGGNGDKTFMLFDDQNNELETQINPTIATFTGLLPGDYFIEIESNNPNCIESVPAAVDGPDEELTIAAIGQTPTSCDLDNGTFTLEIAGGNGTLSVTNLSIAGGTAGGVVYNSTDDTFTYSGLAPGINYTVTVTDDHNCTATVPFVLDEIQTPVFTIVEPADVCLDVSSLDFSVNYDFFEIQATAVPVFNWYESETGGSAITDGSGPLGMSYSVDNSTGALSITDLEAGIYTLWLEMSGPDACNLPRISVDFEIFPLPDPIAPDIANISCFGETDGSIQVNLASGNASDFLFELIGDNGVNISFADNHGLFQNLPAGNYQIFIQNKNTRCQIEADPVTLIEPVELLVNLGTITDPNCDVDNGTIEFTVDGGTPAVDGTYQVEINGQPLGSYSSSTNVEPTGETLIGVTGLAAGSYTVRVIDASGCESTEDFTLTAQILPEYGLTDAAVCLNETAVILPEVLNPGAPDAAPVYRWYKDSTATDEIVDGNDAALELDFTVNSSNGELTVSNFTNAGTYTFYLKPEILNACDFTPVPVEVVVNPLPGPVFEPVPTSCFMGSDGAIELVSGGNGDFSYTLQSGATSFNTSSNRFEGLPAGNYVVQVVNDVTGCRNEFTIEVSEPVELLVNLGTITDPNCDVDNGTIEFTVDGGTPAVDGTYQVEINGQPLGSYSSSTNVEPTGETLIGVTGLAAGSYTVRVIDASGCESTEDFTLTAQILPEYGLTDAAVCLNETAVILPEVLNPGAPDAAPVYRWYKDSTATDEIVDGNDAALELDFTVNSSNGELTVSNFTNAGTYTFYLKPEILNACDLTPVPVEVVVNPLPEVVFEAIPATCFGNNDGVIKLVSGGDPTYTYTLNTGEQNTNGSFNGLTAGLYPIEIQDAIGCVTIVEVEVLEPDPLQIIAVEFTDPTCGDFNGEVVFEITGGTPGYLLNVNSSPLNDFNYQVNGNRYTIQGLEPGSYSVDVVDVNSCNVSAPNLFDLTNNEGLDVVSDPMQDEICQGGIATLIPQLTVPLGASPILRWYFDANATQEIISSNSPDSEGIIYQIGTNSTLTIEGLEPGSFTYYLRISGPGICTKVTEANVTVNAPVEADVIATAITCYGEADGRIEVSNPSGGNGTWEYRLDGGTWQPDPIFENLAAKSYQLQVRDTSGLDGCMFHTEIAVEGPDTPIAINTQDIIRTSCDLANGAIRNVEVTGGWENYTFEWRKDDPVSGTIMPQGTISGIEDLEPGKYYLVIRDSGGCEEVFSFSIGVASDPVYQVVPPIDACFGSPISIQPIHLAPDPALPPAAATEVRWYKEPGQVGRISTGPDPQDPSITYNVDDSDWLNPVLEIENLPVGDHDFYFYVVCTGQEIRVEVTVFDTPAMVFEASPVQCFGDTNGKIFAVSGESSEYTYSLNSGPNMTLAELEAMNLPAGIYTIEVITPAGCPQRLDLEVQGPPASLSYSNYSQVDPGCGAANGKIELDVTGGWLPYTIDIYKNGSLVSTENFSQNEVIINDLTTGDYYLEITDAEGCTLSTPNLNLIDGPTQILVNDQSVCEGELVTLTPVLDPAVSNADFVWSFDAAGSNVINSSPNPDASGVTYQIDNAGTLTIAGLSSAAQPYKYYVTASGNGVCLGYLADPAVSVSDAPSATVNLTPEQCFGDGGRITVNATGGDGTYEYSLDGGAFQSTNIFDVPAGVYSLKVRSGTGCEFSLSDVEVLGPRAPISVSDVKGLNASCNLDNGEISFSISGGYGGYSVETFKDGGSIGSSSADANDDFVISGLSIGTYSFVIKDSSGCPYEFDSPLELTEEPTRIEVDNEQICEGETAVLEPEVTTSSPDATFAWYFDAAGNSPVTSGSTGGVTYTLSPTGELTVVGLPSKSDPYVYYVSAVGTGICGLEPTPASIRVSQIPDLRVSNPSIVCDPTQSVDLTQYIEGYNPSVYDYNVLSPTGSSMQLGELSSVSVSGDYRVSSSTKGTSCWNDHQRIRVIIAEELLEADFEYSVDLGGGNIIVLGEIQILDDVNFTDLSVGNAIAWNWDFGDGGSSTEQNPTYQYQSKGQYTITLTTTDQIGCQSQYQMVVNVFDDYLIMVPNAFTPDGQKNSYFKPVFRGVSDMDFYIFNTWGELIFEANSLETLGWDGTLNGKDVPNGNYVYKAIFTTRSGETVEKAGVFILIR